MSIWNRLDIKNREFLALFHALLVIFLVLSFVLILYILIRGIACHAGFEYYATYLTSSMLAAGVLAALLAITSSMVHLRSKEYMEGAASLLERAYDVLAELDEKGVPKNDRMNWLTAARLILASQELAKKVDLKSHRRILRETEMFWRGKFFDLLRLDEGCFPSKYFADSPKHTFVWGDGIRPPISSRSLAVIYRFTEWPENASDPIQKVPAFLESEIERMDKLGIEGLVSHLKAASEFLEKPERKPD